MEVSVICPVFNTLPEQLSAAVGSVLTQVGDHRVEVILVDDCSTNAATLAALLDVSGGDSRVHVVHLPRNGGPGAARMAGIARSNLDWIGFIDSDDLWPDTKLSLADAAMRERPDAGWIAGNYATLVSDGTLQISKHLSTVIAEHDPGRTAHRISAPHLTRGLIAGWLPLGASLFRRMLIDKAGGFDPRLLYGEDWLLCLRLSTFSSMDYIEAETYVLRRQGMSMMRSPGRMSAKLAHSGHLARRDARLAFIRQELRWFRYKTFKDIAMNNALNGRKLRGLAYALRALLVDPREVRDFALFLRHMHAQGPDLAIGLRPYSTAEQVILSELSVQARKDR